MQVVTRVKRHFEELLQLRSIVEHGSINRAAQAVGMSQSALTRSVARLEAAIGVPLLDRSARGIAPTIYCNALLPHVRAISNELQHAAATLDMLRAGKEGQISVGATIGSLQRLLPMAAASFLTERPHLRIRLVEGLTGSLLGMLRMGELDLVVAVTFTDEGEADLRQDQMAEDRACIFTRACNPVLQRAECSLDDLARTAPWILPLPTGELHRRIAGEFRRVRVPMPTSVIETSSVPVLKRLIRETDRLAISTSQVFDEELQQGSVSALRGAWAFPACRTVLYRPRGGTQPPSVTAFANLLVNTARAWTPLG